MRVFTVFLFSCSYRNDIKPKFSVLLGTFFKITTSPKPKTTRALHSNYFVYVSEMSIEFIGNF